MVDGPDVALALIEPLRDSLEGYLFFHSAVADCWARSGNEARATDAYRRALELATHDSQRRSLNRRRLVR